MRRLLRVHAIFAVIVVAAWVVFLWPLPFDPDYTSGEMVDHVLRWQQGAPLYPPLAGPPYRLLNYPPGFFLLVRALMTMGMGPLAAGRLLAGVSFLVGMIALARWARMAVSDRVEAWLVAALCVGSFPVVYNAAQCQIQWPAIAFSLVGLVCIATSHRRALIIIGAACCTLACFIKHTQVISVVVAGLWLLRYQRCRALSYIVVVVLVGSGGAIAMTAAYGDEVWKDLLTYTVGTYSTTQFFRCLTEDILPGIVFLGVTVWVSITQRALRRDLRWWYLAGSSIWFLAMARVGGGSQYFIEWACAVALCVGPFLLQRMQRSPGISTRGLATLLVCHLLTADISLVARLWRQGERLAGDVAVADPICAALPPPPAAVLAEQIGLLRYCGHAAVMHPFLVTNLAARGLWDETPVVRNLHEGRYPVLLLTFDPVQGAPDVSNERWSPAMLTAMATAYRRDASYGRFHLFRPRSPSPASAD